MRFSLGFWESELPVPSFSGAWFEDSRWGVEGQFYNWLAQSVFGSSSAFVLVWSLSDSLVASPYSCFLNQPKLLVIVSLQSPQQRYLGRLIDPSEAYGPWAGEVGTDVVSISLWHSNEWETLASIPLFRIEMELSLFGSRHRCE